MRINMHHDCVADWKSATVEDRKMRFIWVPNGDLPNESLPQRSACPSENIPLSFARVEATKFVWVAEPNDIILTTYCMEPAFLSYVQKIRSFVPQILTLTSLDFPTALQAKTPSDVATVKQLLALQADDIAICPYRISDRILALSKAIGIRIAGTQSPDIYAKLNDKRYGRTLCRDAGIRVPEGIACYTKGEICAALQAEKGAMFPLLIKQASASSGSGHTLIEDEVAAAQFVTSLDHLRDDHPIAVIIETHLAHDEKSNFSFRVLIARDGALTLIDLHREWIFPPKYNAVMEEFPAGLLESQLSEIQDAAEKIGRVLYQHGVCGSVGCDGIIDRNGVVYPILDINPRFTGDIWGVSLVQQFQPVCRRFANYMISASTEQASFDHVRSALTDLGDPTVADGGLIIQSVKSKTPLPLVPNGRSRLLVDIALYAPTMARLTALTDEVESRLKHFYGVPTL